MRMPHSLKASRQLTNRCSGRGPSAHAAELCTLGHDSLQTSFQLLRLAGAVGVIGCFGFLSWSAANGVLRIRSKGFEGWVGMKVVLRSRLAATALND